MGIEDTTKPYPELICRDCGLEASDGYIRVNWIASGIDLCPVCGEAGLLIESHYFGYPELRGFEDPEDLEEYGI